MTIASPDMPYGGCLRSGPRAVPSTESEAGVVGHLDTCEIGVAATRSRANLLTALARAGFPVTPVA